MIRLPECPICGKPVAPASDLNGHFSPFCSRRCKEVDLIRWCEGRYAIVETIDPRKMEQTEIAFDEGDLDELAEQGLEDDDGYH